MIRMFDERENFIRQFDGLFDEQFDAFAHAFTPFNYGVLFFAWFWTLGNYLLFGVVHRLRRCVREIWINL